jgi:branched-chain amino acid transport system permease protein
VPRTLGLDFDLTVLNFGIFGFLILLVMVLRPQGLVPERRRAMELTEGIGAGDTIGSDSETNVDAGRQP